MRGVIESLQPVFKTCNRSTHNTGTIAVFHSRMSRKKEFKEKNPYNSLALLELISYYWPELRLGVQHQLRVADQALDWYCHIDKGAIWEAGVWIQQPILGLQDNQTYVMNMWVVSDSLWWSSIAWKEISVEVSIHSKMTLKASVLLAFGTSFSWLKFGFLTMSFSGV